MSSFKEIDLSKIYTRNNLLTVTNADGTSKENPCVVKSKSISYNGTVNSNCSYKVIAHNIKSLDTEIDDSLINNLLELKIGGDIDLASINILANSNKLPKNLRKLTYFGANDKIQNHAARIFHLTPLSKSLKEISLPNCYNIECLNAPEEYNQENGLFYNYSSLQKVNLPNVKTIDRGAFNNCSALVFIDINNANEIRDFAFANCNSLPNVSLNTVISLGKGVFQNCTALDSIGEFNYSIESLNDEFFWNCSSLRSIDLNHITIIRNKVFVNCKNLSEVKHHENVTHIGLDAFDGCESLTSLKLLNATKIDSRAFQNCTKLTNVNMPKINTLGDNVFKGCIKLHRIDIGLSTDFNWDESEVYPRNITETSFAGLPNDWFMVLPPIAYVLAKNDPILKKYYNANWKVNDPIAFDKGQHLITTEIIEDVTPIEPTIINEEIGSTIKMKFNESNKVLFENISKVNTDNTKLGIAVIK